VFAASFCAATGSFDLTATNVVLNSLTSTFDITPVMAQWVNLAFLVPLAGLAIPFGRWLDTVGRRGAAVLLTSGLAVASLWAGTAAGFEWLVAARLFQGFFAAGIFPLMNVLTYQATAQKDRARVAAVYAAFVACGGILGPSLGALLTATVGWRWIFASSVPVLVIAVAIFFFRLTNESPLRRPSPQLVREGLLLLVSVSLALFALTGAASYSVWWLTLGLLAVPAFSVWVILERTSSSGVLLKSRDFRRALARLGLHSATGMSIQVLLAFQAQRFFGLSLGETGAALILVAIGSLLASVILTTIGHSWPEPPLMVIGFSLMAVAGLIGATWNTPSVIGIGALSALVGFGQGLARSPAMLAALHLAPARSLGVAGGAISLWRNLGYTAGPAGTAMIWALFNYSDFGLRVAMVAAAGLGLVGVFLSLNRTRDPSEVTN
jgi:MFS family permease